MTQRRALRAAGLALSVLVLPSPLGCSGSSAPPITPATLANTCSQICSNVLSQCGVGSSLYGSCNDACGSLLLAPDTCLNEFASYLSCIVGATSISCSGNTITIDQPMCTSEEESYGTCQNGPTPLAACIALPQSNSQCTSNQGEGIGSTGTAEFCVGQPSGCTALGSDVIPIGTFCCE